MLDKVRDILVDTHDIDPQKISMDAHLVKDLGLYSLDLVNLVVLIEEEFNIEVPDAILHKFIRVGDIVNYLEQLPQQ